jgi:hypothetical protein
MVFGTIPCSGNLRVAKKKDRRNLPRSFDAHKKTAVLKLPAVLIVFKFFENRKSVLDGLLAVSKLPLCQPATTSSDFHKFSVVSSFSLQLSF